MRTLKRFDDIVASSTITLANAMTDQFDHVKELSRAFLIQAGVAPSDIEDSYLGSIPGGLPNSKMVELTADVAFRIRGEGTRYVQLFKKDGEWQPLRMLASNQLAAAHPQLIDEYHDEKWRESARLNQRMAADLQTLLFAENRIDHIQSVRPRCFVDLNHSKALCDIFYTTWDSSEQECTAPARVFARREGQWVEVPGSYHSGMRIHPETGEIFTMFPEQEQTTGDNPSERAQTRRQASQERQMQLTEVRIVNAASRHPTAAEVLAVEHKFGLSLPGGYSEFMTTLGAGILSQFIRVYPPAKVESEIEEWRERIAKYWFWGEGSDLLTQEQALEALVFADTVAGDEFVVHPGGAGRILVLPRHSDQIYIAGGDLWAMVEWTLSTGVLCEPTFDLSFEAFRSET